MAKIKAKLRDLSLRGETTSTRWGAVTFDREGLAELEVEEDQLPLLQGLKWLVGELVEPQEVPAPLPPTPPAPEPAPEPELARPFDTSDSEETPPQGTKKADKPAKGSRR